MVWRGLKWIALIAVNSILFIFLICFQVKSYIFGKLNFWTKKKKLLNESLCWLGSTLKVYDYVYEFKTE